MGKISNYTQVLKAKLADWLVCDQTDNGATDTKKVSVEQIGDTVCGEQTYSGLDTTDKTITGAINELNENSEYHVGNEIEFDNACMFAGIVLASTIRFTIPLDKAIGSDVTKITASGPWFIYSAGTRYLNGSDLSDLGTVTVSFIDNFVNVGIAYSGITPTANEPAILRSGAGCKLTFTTE